MNQAWTFLSAVGNWDAFTSRISVESHPTAMLTSSLGFWHAKYHGTLAYDVKGNQTSRPATLSPRVELGLELDNQLRGRHQLVQPAVWKSRLNTDALEAPSARQPFQGGNVVYVHAGQSE